MKFRVAAGISILVAASVFSDIRLNKPTYEILKKLTGIEEVTPDETAVDLSRVRELKHVLPKQGVVGYVTDDLQNVERRILTQHALVPLLLQGTASSPLVIGNFRDASAMPKIAKERDLELVRDFGNGLVVLRRRVGR